MMRILPLAPILVAAVTGTGALLALHGPVLDPLAMAITKIPAEAAMRAAGHTTASHVSAGVPYVLRDQYSTLICVSSRSGRPLPPFIAPDNGIGSPPSGTPRIGAWMPFVARDATSTQICVSDHAGRLWPPFLAR
jgi:hypothetical protein